MDRNLPPDSWQRVGATVRALREMRGIRAAELAELIGISRPYLVNIEAGRKQLTPVLLAKVARALHVDQLSILTEAREPAAVES